MDDEYEICRACCGRGGDYMEVTGPYGDPDVMWEACYVCRGVGVSVARGPRT